MVRTPRLVLLTSVWDLPDENAAAKHAHRIGRPGRNLTKLWLEPFDISDDEHADFKQRIGNLTLLEEDPNIRASNRSLEKKQQYYAEEQTDFKMTHELQDRSRWGVAEIATDVWNL